jgi:hypothetical protein
MLVHEHSLAALLGSRRTSRLSGKRACSMHEHLGRHSVPLHALKHAIAVAGTLQTMLERFMHAMMHAGC